MFLRLALILVGYLIGSFPTALIYSQLTHKNDIRALGDGNMGARNTKRQFGFGAGVLVALLDILKGTFGVWLAMRAGLPLEWQMLAGAAVILGHDFPIFANFHGGQGFAATTGVFLAFFPMYTLLGFIVYSFLYLALHSSDIAAGVGMGLLVLLFWLRDASLLMLGFMVMALLFVPFKQWLDRSRRALLTPVTASARKKNALK